MKSRTAIKAHEIRREIKALGLTPQDVSVRCESGALDSSIHVTIKTVKALEFKSQLEKILSARENLYRDERSGEILSGGNTFAHVQIQYQLLKEHPELRQKMEACIFVD